MIDHEHDDLLKRLDSLNMDVPPMPEGFHEGWAQRLEDEAMETKPKKFTKTTLIRALSAAAALVFVVGGTLLARRAEEPAGLEKSAAQTRGYDIATEYEYDAGFGILLGAMEEDAVEYGGINGTMTMTMKEAPSERMLIRTASLTVSTQRYDESLSAMLALCENAGGWMASTSESEGSSGLRTCYLTLRIPAEKLDDFLSGTDGLGRVTRRSENVEDVTENYYDTRARLETQQALMARLQALMTDAASLGDLLELESKIADTQYQIDRLQTSLNSTERQVNFATVDVTLREESQAAVIVDAEKTLGERLRGALVSGAEAFVKLMENAVVFLAAALPFIGIIVAVWLIAVIIRKAVQKRR